MKTLDLATVLEQSAARTTTLVNDFGDVGIPKEAMLVLVAEEILRENFWIQSGMDPEILERRNPRLFRNKVLMHYGVELMDVLKEYFDAPFEQAPELAEVAAPSSFVNAYRNQDSEALDKGIRND